MFKKVYHEESTSSSIISKRYEKIYQVKRIKKTTAHTLIMISSSKPISI